MLITTNCIHMFINGVYVGLVSEESLNGRARTPIQFASSFTRPFNDITKFPNRVKCIPERHFGEIASAAGTICIIYVPTLTLVI